MIHKIIDFFVRQKFAAAFITLALIVWGVYSLMNLSVNSIPDISNNQVRVITVSPDLATEEVEKLITYPVELEMANLPGVEEIRSTSKFGLSVVTVVFKDEMGMYLPRQLVKEKISAAKDKIPDGLGGATMGPIMSGLGEIYQYIVDTEPGYDSLYSAMELRTIQDWIIRRQLTGIEGVVEINSWGGYLKQFEVAVDPDALKSKGVTISEVYKALKENNSNTGGAYIERNGSAYFIRGEGLVGSFDDIRKILIKKSGKNPIQIGDVAEVRNGHATRLGAITYNGEGEAVAGQVMMLKGENSMDVIERVKERMDQVRKTLPEGVTIEPYIDRSELIDRTTGTIQENLTLGGLIVIFVLVLLLGNWRSGLLVATVIPLSLLFSLGMMNLFGVTANLMSLGAIDFGIIIDGAVIIVEYVVYQMSRRSDQLRGLVGIQRRNALDDIASSASSRMMRTAFFGQVIILIVFLPILTLTGIEGKMFIPMALAFIFALIGAMILCLTYVPAASSFFLRPSKKKGKDFSQRIMDGIQRVYDPAIQFALRRKRTVLTLAILLVGGSLFVFSRLGGEFVPQLDEGSVVVHPILKPGTSLNETIETCTRIENILIDSFPEVEDIASRIGSAEIPADPMSLEMSDMMVTLKPESEWTSASTKQGLLEEMKEDIHQIPGVKVQFSQPIEMLFSQFISGVNADIAVKIFGPDLDKLVELGDDANSLITPVNGVSSSSVEKVLGLPQIVVKPDREKLAEYGLSMKKVNRVINAGFSGAKAGTVYEGEKRFDLVVRLQEDSRSRIEDLRDLFVDLPNGSQVPLKELADISFSSGPAQISRENTHRRLTLSVNTGDRDVQSVVNDIRSRLDANLDLPPGYHIEYSGDFKNLQKARYHLAWVVPIALALIFILLYITFDSVRHSLMVFTAIPLAATGGILSLWLRGMPFSVSAGVGFIALFGIAVLNGIVLVSFFEELRKEGVKERKDRVLQGTRLRLRPVILTASTDALGFLPMAVSTSAGAEVQRPLATVVAGGLVTSTLLTLIVLPVIYCLFDKARSSGKVSNGGTGSAVGLTTLLLFLGLPFMGTAQEDEDDGDLSQKRAVKEALSNHPSVLRDSLSIERSKKMKKTSYDIGKTNVFYGVNETNGQPDIGIRNVGVTQTIELPFTFNSKAKRWESRKELRKRELSVRKNDLRMYVRKAYQRAVHARSVLDLWERLEVVHKNLKKAAEKKYRTGQIDALERTALQARAREVKAKRKEAQADLEIQKEALRRWMFISDTIPLSLPGIKVMEAGLPEDSAFIGSPEVKMMEQQVHLMEADLQKKRTDLLPELKLTYMSQEVHGMTGFYGYTIGLRVPLGFWSYQGRIQAAKIRVDQQEMAKKEYTSELQSEFRKVLARYRKYKEQLELFREERSKEADLLINNAKKQYNAGAIDYVSYVEYMDQAIRIRMDRLRVVKELNGTLIELDHLIGK